MIYSCKSKIWDLKIQRNLIFNELYRAVIRPYYVDTKLYFEKQKWKNHSSKERSEGEEKKHFLFNLSLYERLEQVLCSKLVKFNHQCLNLKNILDNHNHYILKTSSTFIENVLKQRKTALSLIAHFLIRFN